MQSVKQSIEGEDFVGLFGVACDRYAVLSSAFRENEVLSVPTHKTSIYGTGLLGMFCVGNTRGFLVPYFVSDTELSGLIDFLGPLGVEVNRVSDKFTALGNLICCNDTAAIVSPLLNDFEKIEETLNVNVVSMDLAGLKEVGACIYPTNKGFLAHPDLENQLPKLSEILGVSGKTGTVNFGVPYVSSGLLANTNSFLTGHKTSGIELGVIDQALGFL
ncbi:MAG: translation initiation factor IF-6 [Candidatus Altiarchaeales archaeon]|nr:translation initiation factor IF-6 [Candidatus Altiarchaeales archaeon]